MNVNSAKRFHSLILPLPKAQA